MAPVPTPTRRPTIRRTIFHRKWEPTHPHQHQRARLPRPSPRRSATVVDFSSGSSSVNEAKSCRPAKAAAPARICRDVERIAHPPHEGLGEGGAPARDLVQVAARRWRRAGHGTDASATSIARTWMSAGSTSLIPRQQRRRRQRRADVEVRDLRQRVDTGVGAASAIDLEEIAAGRGADRLHQLALDRPRVGLDLPAAVAGARVFDSELVARHGRRVSRPWQLHDNDDP